MRADIRATSDEPTPVSIWSHPYLNLAGVYSNDTSILDHVFTVNSSYYMATNPSGAATGAFEPVAGTPLDFTTPHTIGERINGTQWWRGTVWGGSGGVGWGWSIPNLLLSRHAPAETDGGYSVAYLLGGLDPATAAEATGFQVAEE